jgi:hypothetical protein
MISTESGLVVGFSKAARVTSTKFVSNKIVA